MEQEGGSVVLGLRERGAGHAVIHALLRRPDMLRRRGACAHLLGLWPLTEQGRVWYRGLQAELAVGRMLSKLGPRWVVMHAVPIGQRDSDIDHVVVGAAGVFTINTKNHSDQNVWVSDRSVQVAGSRCDHIRSSEFEASRTAKLLSAELGWPVPVRAVVAVLDPARLDIKRQPTGVDVLEARKLVRWLKKRPAVMSEPEVAQITSIIGVPRTWQYQPDLDADLDRRQQLQGLQQEIEQAKRRRVAWATILVAALVGTALITAVPLLK